MPQKDLPDVTSDTWLALVYWGVPSPIWSGRSTSRRRISPKRFSADREGWCEKGKIDSILPVHVHPCSPACY
jgi:hypothetical protein